MDDRQLTVGPEGPSGEPGDRVAELLATVLMMLGEAGQDRGWACSGEALRQRLLLAEQVVAVAEGLRLGVLRQVQARPEVVPGCAAGKAAATLLVNRCQVNPWQAARDVAAAEAGDPDTGTLPLLAAAQAAGQISRAHLDVAVAAVARVPAALKTVVLSDGRTGMQRIDAWLLGYCRNHPPATVKQILRELLALLRPDRGDLTADAVTRRSLHYRNDPDTGMLSGTFHLDPASGAEFVTALEALSAPNPDGSARTTDGECETLTDLRTRPQRLADGLRTMAEISMATPGPHRHDPARDADESPDPPGCARRAKADVSVLATWEQLVAAGFAPTDLLATPTHSTGRPPAAGLARLALAGGGDRHGALLDPATLARLACDGIWRRVLLTKDGLPLDVGRGLRLATRAQRIALTARDGGCIIPGCGMPVSWCDIHHHTPWEDGGRTDLDNLYPVCGRHHTEVHAGTWQIEWIDGLPWARPPAHLDRTRRLRRNTTHDARSQARALGQQLAADLGEPSTRRTNAPPAPPAPPAAPPAPPAPPACSARVRRGPAPHTLPRPSARRPRPTMDLCRAPHTHPGQHVRFHLAPLHHPLRQ